MIYLKDDAAQMEMWCYISMPIDLLCSHAIKLNRKEAIFGRKGENMKFMYVGNFDI